MTGVSRGAGSVSQAGVDTTGFWAMAVQGVTNGTPINVNIVSGGSSGGGTVSGTTTVMGTISLSNGTSLTINNTSGNPVPVTFSGSPSVSIFGTPTITGSVSISNSPTVSVTGTHAVTISGTPSVSLAGTSNVTGSVIISNSPTVSISNVSQRVSASSIPVVIASDQSTINTSIIGTPTVSLSGTSSITGSVAISNTPAVTISGTPSVSLSGTSSISGSVGIIGTPNVNISNSPIVSISNVSQKTSAASIPVVIASDQSTINTSIIGTPNVTISGTPSVSLSGTPTITGSVTIASGTVSLAGTSSITGSVGIIGTPSVTISGTPSVSLAGTSSISGSVGIIGTPNVNISNSPIVSISNVSQKTSAASIPVVIASDQSTINTSITGTPTVSLAGTSSVSGTVSLAGTSSITGSVAISNTPTVSISSVGQSLSASSIPVVIASDQSTINASITGTPTVSLAGTSSVTGSVAISNTPSVNVIINDNTTLYNGSLSALGATSGIDTTGYNLIVFQITGSTWAGTLYVEASNDNVNFLPQFVLNINEPTQTDGISSNGIYRLTAVAKYFRFNAQQLTGTVSILAYGRDGNTLPASDALALSLDQNTNVALSTVIRNINVDNNNRIVPSDAPAPICTSFNGTTSFTVIDTTGYQSIAVQLFGTWAGTISFYTSNDTSTQDQIAISGYSASGAATPITTASSNGVYQFPCIGRFFIIKQTAFTSGICQVSAYLRQQPLSISLLSTPAVLISNTPGMNLLQVGGTTTVTPGVAGMLAVGGNIAVGSAPTANPQVTGSVDTSGLVRRLLSDATGRLGLSGLDQTNTQRPLNVLTPATTINNISAIPVTDQSQVDGRSNAETLGQILLELKVLNQQLFQLPIVLNSFLQQGSLAPTVQIDEPDQMRLDPTLFNLNGT